MSSAVKTYTGDSSLIGGWINSDPRQWMEHTGGSGHQRYDRKNKVERAQRLQKKIALNRNITDQ